MNDIFEPKFHKAWNEALIKEKQIRLKWYGDYEAKVAKEAEDVCDEDADEDSEPPCKCRDRGMSPKEMDWPRNGATGTATIIRVADTKSTMRSPTSTLKSKLYEGAGCEGKGRLEYLKRRSEQGPSEKFRSRVCTSWDYGWRHDQDNELTCCLAPRACDIRKRAFDRP